jgi:multiple sugar transport system substrate-binding protein
MSPIELSGLPLGHRRASGASNALTTGFKCIYPQINITWHDQTLAGFESQRLTDVTEIYDLIIYDHPFSGSTAAQQIFLPLDNHLPELVAWRAEDRFFAGNLLDDRQWGLPIEAATQHTVIPVT